jgi:hypothetical protein
MEVRIELVWEWGCVEDCWKVEEDCWKVEEEEGKEELVEGVGLKRKEMVEKRGRKIHQR